jgi:hypothetical protein
MYLMPKQLSPVLFAGTAGIFFAVVNAVKLVPYYALGQFTTDNLLYSLALMPLAPLGVKVGHYLVRRSTPSFYYWVVSFFVVVVGAKLLWVGVSALGATGCHSWRRRCGHGNLSAVYRFRRAGHRSCSLIGSNEATAKIIAPMGD